MKVHHLNCGSFCPHSSNLEFACHCILIESNQELILVDCGYSQADLKNPLRNLGISPYLLKFNFLEENTVIAQVQKLGFSPKDVRHILLTHLDPDHAGGLADFPWATAHVFESEWQATRQTNLIQKLLGRYRQHQFRNHASWSFYDPTKFESWNDFPKFSSLKGIPKEISAIAIPGHSVGHCGYLIEDKEKNLLHAGDAYFQRVEIEKEKQLIPNDILIYGSLLASDAKLRWENLLRLQSLVEKHPEIQVFSSHDLSEYKSLPT